jgi:hypothetical protein
MASNEMLKYLLQGLILQFLSSKKGDKSKDSIREQASIFSVGLLLTRTALLMMKFEKSCEKIETTLDAKMQRLGFNFEVLANNYCHVVKEARIHFRESSPDFWCNYTNY